MRLPGYRDGGRVIADDDRLPSAGNTTEGVSPTAEPPISASEPGNDGNDGRYETHFITESESTADPNPFAAALAATERAEELQRQAARITPIAAQIAQLAATDPFKHRAASFHYQAGLSEGLPDNSQELANRVLWGVQAEQAEQHRLAVANVQAKVPALMPRPAMPQQNLALQGFPEPPVMPPRKASIPMTAPPSRDVPAMGGGKRARDTSMTLTPEERLIARNSIMDRPDMPKMSNDQKEYLYAVNKARLHRMRESGEYRRTTEENG